MMLRHRLRTTMLLGAVVATVLTAGPAQAADEVSIDHVETTDGVVSMVVSVDGVPGGDVGGSDMSVQVDGKAVATQQGGWCRHISEETKEGSWE